MPTYSYACTVCPNTFDIVQSFSDDALATCPQCQGKLRKLYKNVGVVFKGGGFYHTDSRAQNSSTVAEKSNDSNSAPAPTPVASSDSTSSSSAATST